MEATNVRTAAHRTAPPKLTRNRPRAPANVYVALAWLPRHQADQVNRYKVGDDGKTPEQRRTGKMWRKPALEFGERVMIREAQTAQQRHRNAFEAKMIYGRYIGHHGRTGSLLVLNEDG